MMFQKLIASAGLFAVVVSLSGCVVAPESYSNVELIQCAQRGKVFMRHDSFGLCGEELASRLSAGKVSQNDMIAGGMGTDAEIARIGATGNVAAAGVVANGLQNQSMGVHRD
ncbi:hypothetical protein FMJ22_13420 [Klebsiella michiganensis]|uniref:hypothetical protein n=1 Tax=Klebsiella michiganensis TaxID=1134687 RepID=UPI001CCADF64|nr:hypothetical protein [Klebsiella michiganensis]MBZ7392395.1 hypothetical protein [Klebsiella michiganensis]